MSPRAIVYIDGFNLYYGAVKNTPYKWLNVERYFTLLRQNDEIRKIHYFTARVDHPRSVDQDTYLRALSTLPLINIVEGRFKMKEIDCAVKSCTFPGRRRVNVSEEKRTDVNIALQILHNAYADLCDVFVIVSGDSDLVPALDSVKGLFPNKRTVVYVPARFPQRAHAVELRAVADRARTLPLALLKHAQLPHRIPDGSGGVLAKPSDW